MHRTVQTSTLEIAYLESGPADGAPVILSHGWPSDVHDWDEVAAKLASGGFHVFVPWIRGFGPTRFLDAATPRSGQQGALGADLRSFMDALRIGQATLAGYDWGGRASCVVAALWPERVSGLVSITGYTIQNISLAADPAETAQEYRLWYQWYFQTERGRAGLQQNRREIARFLWELWSANWHFEEPVFAATAASLDNPDFVDITIQSYRHRYGYAIGDPVFDDIEQQLAATPPINVPTIVLHGACDGVQPQELSESAASHFLARYERRVIPEVGHFFPRESPDTVVQAIRDLA